MHNINNQVIGTLAIYALSFLLIFFTHIIGDDAPSYGILPLYLSFIIYTVCFCTIFQNRVKELSKTLLVFIYVLIIAQTFAAIVEFHLITNDFITWQDLWNKSNQHYLTTSRSKLGFFWYRPLGVFGQFTMNGVIPILAFLALAYVDKARYNITIGQIYRKHIILGLMVVVNTVYSGSTMAYLFLLTVIMINLFLYLSALYRISIISISLVGFLLLAGYLTQLELGRIIIDAINVNLAVMVHYIEPFLVQGPISLLFGVNHSESIASVDTNLLYLLSMLGIVGLAFHLFTYGSLILIIKNLELKIFLTCLMLGSLHYVVLGNQAVHILVALVLTHYILARENLVVNGVCIPKTVQSLIIKQTT